jgi:hypothetical protein
MKKVLFTVLVAISLFACKNSTETKPDPHEFGENYDSTANMDVIKASFTKGDKSVDKVVFQANRFNKDGKIVEEWLVYDTSKMADLMI